MDYQGIKIPDKIIIVEKQYNWRYRDTDNININQGYIVEAGNKKALESAMNWAEITAYDDSVLEGKNWWEVDKKLHEKWRATAHEVSGIQHEYENGHFSLCLKDAADRSSQGGKLSFWNCVIKCPDRKEFLIGINSEILLNLLLNNTFENGLCKNNIYLGRIKGNAVGAFTPNMPLFAQAQKDEAKRQEVKKANDKYIPGDIVKTLTGKDLYLGTVYQYYSFESGWHYRENYLVVYNKPKLVHIYRSYYNNWHDEETLSEYYNVKNTKVKRIIDGHIDLAGTALEYIKKYNNKRYKEELKKDADGKSRYAWGPAKVAIQYGDCSEMNRDEIIKYLKEEYKKYCSNWYYSLESEYKIISEEEWEALK